MSEEDEGTVEGRVTMETAIGRIDEQNLELFYRVTNGLEHPIVLMTPLSRIDVGTMRADRSRVYAYVDPEGILQITKRLWPVPEEVEVVFPDVPFVTEVGPGRSFEERIVLPLPIAVDYPYQFALERVERESEVVGMVSGMAFSVGYLVEQNATVHAEGRGSEAGNGRIVHLGMVAERQRIIQGGSMMLMAPVKEQTQKEQRCG